MNSNWVNPNLHAYCQHFMKTSLVGYQKDGIHEIMQLQSDIGEGTFQRFQIRNGVEIAIVDYQLYQQMSIKSSTESPFIEFQFMQKGEMEYDIEGKAYSAIENRYQCAISTTNHRKLYFEPNIPISVVKLGISPDLLEEYPGADSNNLYQSIQKILTSTKYHGTDDEMTSDIQLILYQIQSLTYSGSLKRMYLEGKVLELLATLLHLQFSDRSFQESKVNLSAIDVQCIYHARDLMLHQLENPPTLKELAKQAGINEYKLKVGFREVFHTTVFGYLRQERMNRAIILLEKGDLSISEVAMKVGYINKSKFAAAFKETFGFNPSQYKSAKKN